VRGGPPDVLHKLESLLDAVLDGVVLLDTGGRIEFLNPEACRILESSREAAAGLPIEELIGGEHSISNLSRIVLASGRPAIQREQAIERKLEPDLYVDVEAAPLMEGHTVNGVVLMLRDCTIQNNQREIVNQREALSSFGRIAAGIAHEVKNPLGGIRGAAEILLSRASDDRSKRAADLIVREVDRIALLVDDFMVFTKGDELRLASVNIHRVLDDVLALALLDPIGRQVEIKREFDPSIPEFAGDFDRLVQVFLNLTRNALQAIEGEQGELVISTRMTLDHRLSSKDGRHLPTLMVKLVDNGTGIDAPTLEKLATPFFTTRIGGTGLGLAVSRHWVARHEGTLRIESTPGLGTSVFVALPIST
jgi:two-component system nitrogen regulation sensor histidine kinase GlnL